MTSWKCSHENIFVAPPNPCNRLMFLQLYFSSSQPLKAPPTNGNKQAPSITIKPSLSKGKTQISSIYTKLSSITPTNTNSSSNANVRNSSIPNYVNSKTVKTTQIGNSQGSPTKSAPRSPVKSPKRIPQLVKPALINGASKIAAKSLISFMPKDNSNGNSATSSLSTSSSNSSLNINGVSPVRNFVWKVKVISDHKLKSITNWKKW